MSQVDVSYDKETRIGPWLVSASVLKKNNKKEVLKAMAVECWETLMTGEIMYAIQVPTDEGTARPLQFVSEYTKAARPAAWKCTDLKIQSTLPLLGNDSESIHQLAKFAPTTLVVVKLSLRRESS